jgi:adenylate cyclase
MQRTLKRLVWDWRGVLFSAPIVAGLVILLRWVGLFQSWEWAAFDQYVYLRPIEPRDDTIVIVGIDEADMREMGQGIIRDSVVAQLLEKLKARHPRAIGLDIYRDLPVEPGHQELLRVFESTPNLVGIQKVVGDTRHEAVAAPPVLKAKGQVGSNDVILDADSKLRRGLLYVEAPQTGETVFSFGLYTALLYLDAQGIKPQALKGTTNWRLGKTTFVPFEANDGGYVRADARGFQMLLNYRGPAKHFSTVSLTDILKDRVPPDWGRDRIILIGYVGASFQDFHSTPYSSNLFTLPERMAGVEVHANIASQIISAALDGRPLFKSWSEPFECLWILSWCFIGGILSWRNRYMGGIKQFSFRRANSLLFAGVTLVGITYVAFLGGWWIPVVPPILALGSCAIAITAYIARTAGEIRKAFGRYLTDEVVANILEQPEGLRLGGERRKMTLLTSDLRGFTSVSERLPPEEVVKILNIYLGSMADVITQYQGTIDEFMGDGILVLFGAPTIREDDAQRAVACAVAMQLAMVRVNEIIKQRGLPQLEMGIGINTGVVVVGNIGSEKRTKYGVVGGQVNLTYRIESYTVGGEILISESTLKEVESIVILESQRKVQPKGVKQPTTIYKVGGIGGQYNLLLSKEEEAFFPLAEAILIEYLVLDGKHVSETLCKGRLVKLSAKGAEVRLETLVPAFSNIKLNFLSSDNSIQNSDEVYAKVLEEQAEDGNFRIRFTSLPPDVEVMIKNLYQACVSGN